MRKLFVIALLVALIPFTTGCRVGGLWGFDDDTGVVVGAGSEQTKTVSADMLVVPVTGVDATEDELKNSGGVAANINIPRYVKLTSGTTTGYLRNFKYKRNATTGKYDLFFYSSISQVFASPTGTTTVSFATVSRTSTITMATNIGGVETPITSTITLSQVVVTVTQTVSVTSTQTTVSEGDAIAAITGTTTTTTTTTITTTTVVGIVVTTGGFTTSTYTVSTTTTTGVTATSTTVIPTPFAVSQVTYVPTTGNAVPLGTVAPTTKVPFNQATFKVKFTKPLASKPSFTFKASKLSSTDAVVNTVEIKSTDTGYITTDWQTASSDTVTITITSSTTDSSKALDPNTKYNVEFVSGDIMESGATTAATFVAGTYYQFMTKAAALVSYNGNAVTATGVTIAPTTQNATLVFDYDLASDFTTKMAAATVEKTVGTSKVTVDYSTYFGTPSMTDAKTVMIPFKKTMTAGDYSIKFLSGDLKDKNGNAIDTTTVLTFKVQ